MQKEEIKNTLGVGVPVYRPVPLKTAALTSSCALNKKNSYDALNAIKDNMTNKIEEVTGKKTSKSTSHPFTKIAFENTLEDSSASFTFGEERKIMNIFDEVIEKGVKNYGMSEEEYKQAIYKASLYQFARMYNPDEKEKFISEYAKLVRKLGHKADGMKKSPERYGTNITDYFVNQAEYYKGAMDGLDTILSYDTDKEFTDYLDTLDVEKTLIFMAYTYLFYMDCFLKHGDKKLATELSFFVDGFIKNRDNRKLHMFINGKNVSYDGIKKVYDEMVEKYDLTKIRLTHSLFKGKSFEENIDIINSLLNVKTVFSNEILVKPDSEGNIEKTTTRGNARIIKPLTEEESELVAEFVAKRYYVYLKHNPILQVECKNRLSNYIAFLYENGMMPADRINNLTRLHQRQDDRAFVFDVTNFDDLVGLKKSELRLHPKVKPMNHTDSFERRMDKVITQETSEELHKAASEYVLKRK